MKDRGGRFLSALKDEVSTPKIDECNVFGGLDHVEQGHSFAGGQIREIVLFGHDLSFFRLFAAGVMGL